MSNLIQLYFIASIYVASHRTIVTIFDPEGFGEWQNLVQGPQNFKYLT